MVTKFQKYTRLKRITNQLSFVYTIAKSLYVLLTCQILFSCNSYEHCCISNLCQFVLWLQILNKYSNFGHIKQIIIYPKNLSIHLIERQLESNLVEHTPQYKKETKRLENNIMDTTVPSRKLEEKIAMFFFFVLCNRLLMVVYYYMLHGYMVTSITILFHTMSFF